MNNTLCVCCKKNKREPVRMVEPDLGGISARCGECQSLCTNCGENPISIDGKTMYCVACNVLFREEMDEMDYWINKMEITGRDDYYGYEDDQWRNYKG